jgi:hypothetical protein
MIFILEFHHTSSCAGMPHRFQLEIEFIRLKEERLLKKHIEQTHVFQTRKFNFKQKRQDILAFPVRREKK